MQLQPSTQSWRVIWVRAGRARRSARLSDSGVWTSPSTVSLKSENVFAARLRNARSGGSMVPFGLNQGEIIEAGNSRASVAGDISRRWTYWLASSPT